MYVCVCNIFGEFEWKFYHLDIHECGFNRENCGYHWESLGCYIWSGASGEYVTLPSKRVIHHEASRGSGLDELIMVSGRGVA